jgi:beta-glucosidase
MARHDSPQTLAALVVARMTTEEKLGELALSASGRYENVNSGVDRLCIPSLTLQDGPAGLAFGDTGVTQLPAPLGIAATFDPSIARQYGQVEGEEARGQGIDVVQGPNLNIDRVPESGRAFEGYGEDPLLVSAMGVADIEGIQSQGVLADAKHLVTYSQETNRGALNTLVSSRALNEIYLAPFKAAVTQAHVASIMCAYPQLNGTFQCEDPGLAQVLLAWGFSGFVRSDLGAVHDPAAALSAGTDLLKPTSVADLTTAVSLGSVPVTTLDTDVERMLTQMFAYGLVGQTSTGVPGTPVDTTAHAAFALSAAERSAVLLQNRSNVLPIDPARVRSMAVIGADASTAPVTAGFGSSHVTAPFTSTPLAAIQGRMGASVAVQYADGGSTTRPLPGIPTVDLTPTSGTGHGLTLTVGHSAVGGSSITGVDPVAAAAIDVTPANALPIPGQLHSNPPADRLRNGVSADASGERLNPDVDPSAKLGTIVELPHSWGGATASWMGTLTPPRTGLYSFSVTGSGSETLTLDGLNVVSDPLAHAQGTWSGSVNLAAGHPYRLALNWIPVSDGLPVHNILKLGMAFDGDAIAAAVAAARASQVAVVFAADYSSETFDRPRLSLPGDQNALISAVAAANPKTVVVLNTGGPVLMPWLGSVAAVVEAWYAGEQDGAAIAAVLCGDVNPSGHLPVTFPASQAQSAVPTTAQWPGTGLTSKYSEGLAVGYRFNNATGIRPLFPFGFGLSYTTFSYGNATAAVSGRGYRVSVTVTNTGGRAGTDVAQAYLTFPAGSGEPPGRLVAFQPVSLAPGATQTVTMTVPSSAFQVFQGTALTTVPGTYTVGIGDSSESLATQTSLVVG